MLAVFFLAACQPSGPDCNPPDPADRVDGNRVRTSGRPCRASRGNAAKEQELAERAACPRGRLRRAATFLRKVGIEVGARPSRTPTIRRGRARKRRGATVRTVRIVRPRNYTIAVQRLAGGRTVLRTVTGPIPPQPSAPTP